MRVKLATQIFSRTVTAGVRTMSDFDKFSIETKPFVSSTANFIEKVDRLFDNLNSKVLFDPNPQKCGLKTDNQVFKNLNSMLSYFDQIKPISKTTVYCLNGIIQTIKGVLLLLDHLKQNNSGIDFILTSRLNQDPIENFFGLIRQRGGNSTNPSVFEFNHSVAKIMSMKFLENSSLTNCENDVDEMLIPDILTDTVSQPDDNIFNCSADGISESPDKSENNDLDLVMVEADVDYGDNFDDSSLRYFIGFVAHKHLKKTKCANCAEVLIKSEEILEAKSERFMVYKNFTNNSNFGSLHAPSEIFFKISKVQIEVFSNVFKEQPHMEKIKSHIRDVGVDHTKKKTEFSFWFNENNPCYQHNLEILDYILLILLRKHSKWSTKKFIGANKQKRSSHTKQNQPSGAKQHRKLKIIDA